MVACNDAGIEPFDHSEQRPAFDLPRLSEFERLGVTLDRELHGGHQSRVWLATSQYGSKVHDLVVKLIDVSSGDRADALARLRVRHEASRYDDRVVPIVPLGGQVVNRIENCLVVASPHIDGRFLDVTNRPDVERMGRAMARLHQSLRLVHIELPPVRALSTGPLIEGLSDNHQLLHGDFAPSNLLLDSEGRLWIYDFDDSGRGPVEFELGNTLFMALFDTSPSLNQPSAEYRQFRHWFLGAYKASAEHPVSEMLVDIGLQARSDALRYWLHHLDEAPVGIRTASESWHRHLRAFAGILQP